MKYNRMVCWVNRHDAKEIRKARADHQILLVFAKNYDDFKSLIQKDDYLVFSVKMVKRGMKNVLELVRGFPDYFFHLCENPGDMTLNEMIIQEEPNVSCMITPKGLIQEFLGTFDAQKALDAYIDEV